MSSCIQEDFLIERSVLVFVFVFVFLCVFVIVLVTSRWTLVLSSFRRCMICEWQCSNSRNVALYWWSAHRLEKKKKKKKERKSHSKVGTRWVRQKCWSFQLFKKMKGVILQIVPPNILFSIYISGRVIWLSNILFNCEISNSGGLYSVNLLEQRSSKGTLP